VNWAYLAGFTDGDGCVTVEYGRGNRYFFGRIRWSQKAAASQVLHEIADFLRSNDIKVTERNFSIATAGHKYPQMELAITNAEDTRRALTEMLPYLIVKRERAVQLLSVLNSVKALKEKHGNKYRVALRKVVG
jgi:intein/homing endonuclease